MRADRLRAFAAGALIAMTAPLGGCVIYTIGTAASPTREISDTMFGVRLGPTTDEELRRGGWALADTKDGAQMYLLAAPDKTINDVEAQVIAHDGTPSVQYLRIRFAHTRFATYKELLAKMQAKYGPPQTSETTTHFDLFDPDPTTADAPLPPSFVVHRWTGSHADLVLVGGLEDPEVLISFMQYQVLLVPHGAAMTSGG